MKSKSDLIVVHHNKIVINITKNMKILTNFVLHPKTRKNLIFSKKIIKLFQKQINMINKQKLIL
jgi:hypothetical protein